MNDPTEAGLCTSGSNPSLRPINNRTESTRSTVSRVASYRHVLLKSNTQRQHLIEKDLPIPPVLTHKPPNLTDEDATQSSKPSRSTIAQVSQVPQAPPSQTHTPTEKPMEVAMVDINPAVHPTGQVAPRGTDRDLREVTGGGICSPGDDHDHFQTRRLPISKVRPAVYDVEQDGKLNVQCEYPSASPILSGSLYTLEDHFCHSRMNTPKVRPFMNSSSVQVSNPHEGHHRSPKVRPYFGSSNIVRESGETPTNEESQKMAIYWGFLPRFRDGRSKLRQEINQQEDRRALPGSHRESSHPSQVGYQRSLASVQPSNLESNHRQENIRQEDETYKGNSGASNDHSEGKMTPGSNGNGSGRSTALVSPTSPQKSAPVSVNQTLESHPPERLRATRWLRGLLGSSEAEAPPTFTELPEKTSSQRQPYEECPSDEAGTLASRVTTYSGKNAADKKAVNNAMHSLEHLLTEALSLANETSERECYGHLDYANLPLEPTSEDSIHNPSVHESIRCGSSKQEGVTLVGAPPNGCEVLPLRSVKSLGPAKFTERDGQILGPSSSHRSASARCLRRRMRQHTADDDCVLPMPPPDRRLKRDCAVPRPDAYHEDDPTGVIRIRPGEPPNSREVREYIRIFHQPPISARNSSKTTCEVRELTCHDNDPCLKNRLSEIQRQDTSVCSLDGTTSDEVIDFSNQYNTNEKPRPGFGGFGRASRRDKDKQPAKHPREPPEKRAMPTKHAREFRNISLRNRSHVSITEGQRFSLRKSAKRQPIIARDWSPARKRFVAAVACISTALVGMLIGIYAGLVPSIQYYIADFHHHAILGNVGLYLGMALATFFCWPLPLLHGRKPYIVGSLCVAMPLLFPQAIAISARRSPDTCVWRVALLLSRALMGFVLGLASMNFHSMLTDLFGTSLMSNNPHQEVVDEYDVRRHGGGLGVWLGIWTWCFIGSISVGFLIGAVVIDWLQPSWGLYISIIIIAIVLLLNVLCPEVRRSAWRRSVAEVRMGETISRRLARGEVMMHRVQTGPAWWGQEVYHGVALSLEMLRQPGFTVMAVYSAWIYAQVVLIIVLLGSLTSKSYRYRSPYVGGAVSSVAIGALAAIPFQKANVFSRARKMSPLANSTTFDKKIIWSSHLVRRAIFTVILPIAGIIYTVLSTGPPVHVVFPSFFAALIGFLSCLAISECNGLLIETWDCSDLQPGMTGRSQSLKDSHKRTNYSSFPRVTAGWNFIQSLGFIFAAGATGLGGSVTRRLGQREATGVVAGILFILTLLLLGTLIRFKRVQIIPNCTCSEMDQWKKERRVSLHNWAAAKAAAKEKGSKELNEILKEDVG
ncbi:hypothetical protein HD806DRAFT_520814 [Xylariaceae sp. AK1471]|nr:hypothetical protein HD806DRAFT_520814 [Xylariaceae sp. AK1471]